MNNKEVIVDYQDNLDVLITNIVKDGKRECRIVDGDNGVNLDSHIFYTYYVKDLGETDDAFTKMTKEANKDYCTRYAKIKNEVRKYYEEKYK